MNQLIILLQIAFRNLFSNFLNVVIGGIVFVGTMLFVVGSSLLNSMDSAMSKSIIGSVAGHVQVYSDKSKDELALYGGFANFPDLHEISDFSEIKPALMSVENVKAVIPMGINYSELTYGNTLDVVLERLRKAIEQKKKKNSAELSLKVDSLKSHVRQIVKVIQEDYKKLSVISSAGGIDKKSIADLKKASSDEFWMSFDKDPLNNLEFLENKIAFLLPDADYGQLAYVGTDLDAFKHNFDRMEIVDGQMVPDGKRGLLLSKYTYENYVKLKTATRLDQIKEGIDVKHSTIAKDPDLQFLVKQNRNQLREIILQLDPMANAKLTRLLQNYLNIKSQELAQLLTGFFDLNDKNFNERYKYFYANIAPMLELYRVRIGDTFTIKAYTKSGYIESANLKLYGTFQFKGLEKSALAGSLSLMDLMSFRDLYGYMTPERLAEIKQIEKAAGARIIARESVEDELFGDSSESSLVTTQKQTKIDEKKELGLIQKADFRADRAYTQDEIDKGVFLNAAIILKDPSRIKETMERINEISKKNSLGLRVVTWQKAAGMIGQFVLVAKAILYLVVLIIFIVALVIINNAVMMATLQRVQEIGTMRAIGAHQSFVLAMILVETVILGLTFGVAGTTAGSFIVGALGSSGIPAANEFLFFFFSGPRLYPTLGAGSIIGSMLIIFVVTTISALYPAILATRVSPITAMQSEE